jgi:hypothetical protein
VAGDLFPDKVDQRIKRRTTIGLNLGLKFQVVEAKIAEATFGFEYDELVPLVSSAGAGQSTVSWDYEKAKGISLQGDKWMVLLVEAKKGTPSGIVALSIKADIQKGPLPFPAAIPLFRLPRSAKSEAILWGRRS